MIPTLSALPRPAWPCLAPPSHAAPRHARPDVVGLIITHFYKQSGRKAGLGKGGGRCGEAVVTNEPSGSGVGRRSGGD